MVFMLLSWVSGESFMSLVVSSGDLGPPALEQQCARAGAEVLIAV
jgi:hypothetical protein